jgi:thiol-disulfide isomerase/thioredoxin
MRSLSRSAGRTLKKAMSGKYFVLILLLVVVGGYFIFNWCQTGKFEFFSGNSKLLFFYADWCGHCKNFKPKWEELEANHTDLGIGFEKINCSDDMPELGKKYGVEGFPTLILVKGDQHFEYQGQREPSAIVSFIKEHQ